MSWTEKTQVLHWLGRGQRWEEIGWAAWCAFRGMDVPFKPLRGVESGLHYFAVCAHDGVHTREIFQHKYLIDPGGKIGAADFAGLTKQERAEYDRLVSILNTSAAEQKRLNEIHAKMLKGHALPPHVVTAIRGALKFPPGAGSEADGLLRSAEAVTGPGSDTSRT